MKKIAFALVTALLISSATFASFEKTAPGSVDHHNITEQLTDQIESSHIMDYVDMDQGVDLTFMIDSQNRLVLLDIAGQNDRIIKEFKSELRGLEISAEDHQLDQVYKIHIDFDVRNYTP